MRHNPASDAANTVLHSPRNRPYPLHRAARYACPCSTPFLPCLSWPPNNIENPKNIMSTTFRDPCIEKFLMRYVGILGDILSHLVTSPGWNVSAGLMGWRIAE